MRRAHSEAEGVLALETVLGRLAFEWGAAGLQSLRFQEDAASRGTTPAWLQELAERARAHLAGERLDTFADVPLDWSWATAFQREVLEACREIPPGEVCTYGALAEAAGRSPQAARAVGGALAANQVLLVVPCHRVLAKGGPGGFSAPGGFATKARLLAAEGVTL